MLRQYHSQMSAGALHVFPSGGFGTVHGFGDLFVWQFLKYTQRDGHGLTAGKSINGRQDLAGEFPSGEFLPWRRGTIDKPVGPVLRYDPRRSRPRRRATSHAESMQILSTSAWGLACVLIRRWFFQIVMSAFCIASSASWAFRVILHTERIMRSSIGSMIC